MKKRRTTFMALIMTTVMMIATAMPVGATGTTDPGTTPDPLTTLGTSPITQIPLSKVLTLSEGVNTPNTSFAFEVIPDTSVNAGIKPQSANYHDHSPETGVEGGLTAPSGSISASNAVDGENNTLNLTVNPTAFSTFGVYRYVLTETDSGVKGMNYDPTKYYIDLYMEYNNGVLECESAWAFTVTSVEGGSSDVVSSKIDALEFSNAFRTTEDRGKLYHVKVEKEVTGNQGRHDVDFTFTLTYDTKTSNDGENNRTLKYKKDGTGITTHTWTDIESDGTFTLKHGQNIILEGLAEGDTFSITETQLDGYSGKVTEKIKDAITNEVTATEKVALQAAGENVAFSDAVTVERDYEYLFTNDRTGIVPTGIFLNYKPFWIMGGVAVVLLIVFVGRRKNRYAEEL